MKDLLRAKQKEMLQLLELLVNIDSGSYTKAGIDEVGRILKMKFEEMDFVVETVNQKSYGNHLFIRHREQNEEPPILIIGHMDTVFPEGTAQKRPFKIKGTRAYGPGVADMKASLVELVYALQCMKWMGKTGYKRVQVILNSDEEIGSPTSAPLICEKAVNKKYALVLEPARPDGSLVTSRRGSGRYKVVVEGKAAHSGIEPEKGHSAIEELSYKIIALQQLNDYGKGISVNVGIIKGGTAINSVPARAYAMVDVRVSEKKQGAFVVKQLKEICARTHVKGTKTTLSGKLDRPPMEKSLQTGQLFETIRKAGEEIGLQLTDTATGGGSDASFTAQLGIPTVDGLGPVGGKAHSEDEYLEVSSLLERTHLLATVIETLSQ